MRLRTPVNTYRPHYGFVQHGVLCRWLSCGCNNVRSLAFSPTAYATEGTPWRSCIKIMYARLIEKLYLWQI